MFTGTSRLFYSGLYTCAPTRMLAWRAKPQEAANAGTRAEISYSKPFKTKTHFCVRAKVLLLCNARRSWRLKTWLRLKNVRCWLRSYIFNRQKKRYGILQELRETSACIEISEPTSQILDASERVQSIPHAAPAPLGAFTCTFFRAFLRGTEWIARAEMSV